MSDIASRLRAQTPLMNAFFICSSSAFRPEISLSSFSCSSSHSLRSASTRPVRSSIISTFCCSMPASYLARKLLWMFLCTWLLQDLKAVPTWYEFRRCASQSLSFRLVSLPFACCMLHAAIAFTRTSTEWDLSRVRARKSTALWKLVESRWASASLAASLSFRMSISSCFAAAARIHSLRSLSTAAVSCSSIWDLARTKNSITSRLILLQSSSRRRERYSESSRWP
mmetsp:Transcript_34824/g.82624  ORF Transcript_34824/g.82624 Transcript_34824/m.82624 type:complete len:226 (-) Transcript_34824:359-1036(-)